MASAALASLKLGIAEEVLYYMPHSAQARYDTVSGFNKSGK